MATTIDRRKSRARAVVPVDRRRQSTREDADRVFLESVGRIARDTSSPAADSVDREGRFPVETVGALRDGGLLSAFVPVELGGGGVSFSALAQAATLLGRACGASAMVFAMHQIQVVTIVRHLEGAPWFEEYLRSVCAEQRLIASVTSEVGTGGDMGRSVAALTSEGKGKGRYSFRKQAPTVSYGAYADDLFVTLRRSPGSEPGDQVIVLAEGPQDFTLLPTGTWDPLGMRGTCSPGYTVSATLSSDQVLPTPFARASAESMVPVSHILWSHLWLGIASDAFERARAFVKAAARRTPGEVPPTAVALSRVMSELSLLRAEVSCALSDFQRVCEEGDRESLTTISAALRFNNLKIASSEQAPRICQGAMGVCGIMGFKNDTPFSVGRHLRDTMSACLMVANERIHQTNASLLLIAKDV